MNESKIELTERLRRDGRWPEASQFKDATIKELRRGGMKKADAAELAWEKLAEKYPPAATSEGKSVLLANAPEIDTAGAINIFPVPESPNGQAGQDEELFDVDELLNKRPPDFPRDVTWVYERLADRNAKPQDAPTAGAWALLRWARENKNRFFEIVLPKAKINVAEEDDEGKRRKERRSIGEIQRVLEQLNLQEAEEMAADVPKAIRGKLGSILADLERQYAVTLPDNARKILEAELTGLVGQCVNSGTSVLEIE